MFIMLISNLFTFNGRHLIKVLVLGIEIKKLKKLLDDGKFVLLVLDYFQVGQLWLTKSSLADTQQIFFSVCLLPKIYKH
jgi:hypothetical protein